MRGTEYIYNKHTHTHMILTSREFHSRWYSGDQTWKMSISLCYVLVGLLSIYCECPFLFVVIVVVVVEYMQLWIEQQSIGSSNSSSACFFKRVHFISFLVHSIYFHIFFVSFRFVLLEPRKLNRWKNGAQCVQWWWWWCWYGCIIYELSLLLLLLLYCLGVCMLLCCIHHL